MTTNYQGTFISVAADCPATSGQQPPVNDSKPSIAALQYQLIAENPYRLTSDEVLFAVHAARSGLAEPAALDAERERFLAKDHACLRASPLSKRYGWGTHHDAEGRVALYGVGTAEYERLAADPNLVHKSAMRSARA